MGFYFPTGKLNCLTINTTPAPEGKYLHTGRAPASYRGSWEVPVGFNFPTGRLNCLTVNITPVPVGISRHTGSAWTLAGRRLGYSKEASPPRIARPSTAQATCCSTNGPTNGATSGGNMQLNQQSHQRQRQKEVSATAAICSAASRFNNGHTSGR